jgi:UDP-N-acetylmuramyl tripeptide synthase
MRIISVSILRGPNLFSRSRLIRVRLEGATAKPFVAHAAESLAAALQARVGLGAVAEVRRPSTEPGAVDMFYPYVVEEVGRLAGRLALQQVEGDVERLDRLGPGPDRPIDMEEAIATLSALAEEVAPPLLRKLVNGAERRETPLTRLEDGALQLGWGAAQRRVRVAGGRILAEHGEDLGGDAEAVLGGFFGDSGNGRVPVVAITGTNGKSTTTRMVEGILRGHGRAVGLTSTTGVYVNGERILEGDASGPRSARLVLSDERVETAVLEVARGGMLREGLGYDAADVGALLNVQADHLGLKGIDTIEDLARVKSVVVEAVRPDGWSVLNADDPLAVAAKARAGGVPAYFSLRPVEESELLSAHVASGGLALVREPGPEGGVLVVRHGPERYEIIKVGEIPAAFAGAAEFNVANAMAAALIALGLGVPVSVIRSGLAGFASTFEQNPGRLNVVDKEGVRVIVDYAHNPAGLEALGRLIQAVRPQHRRTIGMVTTAGDRRDEDIRQMGALAVDYFDEIYFREDPSRRGRAEGEILKLLMDGALSRGVDERRLHCISHESKAADACLRAAVAGDLVVLTPTEVEAMWRQVQAFERNRSAAAA